MGNTSTLEEVYDLEKLSYEEILRLQTYKKYLNRKSTDKNNSQPHNILGTIQEESYSN